MESESWVVAMVVYKAWVDGGKLIEERRLALRQYSGCSQNDAVGQATVSVLNEYTSWGILLMRTLRVELPKTEVVDLTATVDLSKVVVGKIELASLLAFVRAQHPDRTLPVNTAIETLQATLEGKG